MGAGFREPGEPGSRLCDEVTIPGAHAIRGDTVTRWQDRPALMGPDLEQPKVVFTL